MVYHLSEPSCNHHSVDFYFTLDISYFCITQFSMVSKIDINRLTKFYPLQFWPQNPSLRTPCHTVRVEELCNGSIQSLCIAIEELMREYDGVGLSAPQIGQHKRVIAITTRKWWKNSGSFQQQIVMINPEITQHSDTTFVSDEWCLSLPNVWWKVARYKWVIVQYLTPAGESFSQKFVGFMNEIMI